MFVCNKCLNERFTNGESMFKSNGTCECCGQKNVCNEIPSKYLNLKSKRGTKK